jgi:hemerythrin superfamily protein
MRVESGTLAEHHRRCDALFAAARRAADAAQWGEIGARVNELREAVLSHFSFEEKHIFPLYEQQSGEEGATEWLCAQHDDMRGAFWILGTISATDDPKRFRVELAALQDAFDAHAAEEEKRMYPVFERMLAKR